MTTAELVDRLKGHKSGNGFVARCPAHEDKNPSLSISTGTDGRILLKCHVGCTAEMICSAAGIKLSDLFNDEKPHPNGKARRIVTFYDYHDETGNLLFQVVRYDPKDFRQRKPDVSSIDGWSWSVKGIRRVPYRLPEVLKAVAEHRPVFICEGEKDVNAVVGLGFTATCNSGGGGNWQEDLGQYFDGAEVCIIADKDKAGRDHAQDVALKLAAHAATIRVLELPDSDERKVKDAHDWIAGGGQAAELDELWQAAPLWTQNRQSDAENPPKPALQVKRLCDLQPRLKDDPSELLKTGFLCRGAALLLAGPTGVGKSALAMQFKICWAIGQAVFGIEPTRPLKSLLVQAENDEGDLYEMKQGVLAGLNLTPAQRKEAESNIITIQEDRRTVRLFCDEVLAPLLKEHKPDLLWIDPMFAYIGGNASGQEHVTPFLRNMLNPLIREAQCGLVALHHANKPPTGKEKSSWAGSDLAYVGSGSIEWANWARAILAMRCLGSYDVYELIAAKRGARLGWLNDDGSRSFKREIAHWKEPGVICWREADPNESGRPGRPKSTDADEVLALLPSTGLSSSEWMALAKSECGIKDRTFFRLKKTLADTGRVHKSSTNDHWQPILKKP